MNCPPDGGYNSFRMRLNKQYLILGFGIKIIVVAAAYAATAWLGLFFAIPPGIATPVWLPSGVALAAVLVFGKRIWPGIVLGSFLVNFKVLFNSSHLLPSFAAPLFIAFSSALQAVAGAVLIRRFRVSIPFDCVKNFFKFTWIEIFACLVSAAIGTASLFLSRYISWSAIYDTWWIWWTGNVAGVIIGAPFLIIWSGSFRKFENQEIMWKTFFYVLALTVISCGVFGRDLFRTSLHIYLMPYSLVPLVIWSAYRLGQRGVTFSILLISGIAVWGTVHGHGYSTGRMPDDSFLLLQLFIGVLTMTGLTLSAALAESQHIYEELKTSRKDLVDFFEHAPLGFNWVGPNGIIIWANEAELDLLGYSSQEYVGHSITEFHVKIEVVKDMLNRLKNHEELQEYETRLRCKDGSIKDVVISSNVLWEKGQFIHTRCFTRDITERKRAKADLMKAHAELEDRVKERTEELSEAYEILKSEMNKLWRAQKDILEISDREQKRIGQDLHDGLAQQLSGISLMSKSLQYKLAEKYLPEEKDVVKILDFLKFAIEDTRRVSRGFYPVELENLGLFPALEELAANMEKMYGIPCKWQIDHSIEIGDEVAEKHIYRMTQEAILNAMKHGKPSRVILALKRVSGDVVLSIEDDGIGIDKNKLVAQMGIRIMEYRAKMIGASFSIDNHDEGGTRVTFIFQPEWLPLVIKRGIPE